MQETTAEESIFGAERIGRVLLKIAPPVMLAQLIQALYNIVDSFFVGKYSTDALTAVTVIYPIQLIIVALAVGTGVGVNTFMAREYALREEQNARDTAGTGTVLARTRQWPGYEALGRAEGVTFRAASTTRLS